MFCYKFLTVDWVTMGQQVWVNGCVLFSLLMTCGAWVRCVTSACNAILTTSDGAATLSNYGLRRNCSLLFVYPELIDVVRLEVGQISSSRTRASFGLVSLAAIRTSQRHGRIDAVTYTSNCGPINKTHSPFAAVAVFRPRDVWNENGEEIVWFNAQLSSGFLFNRVDLKNGTFLYTKLWLRQILTDFQTFLTARIRREFVIMLSLKIPSHLKYIATLLCEILNILKQQQKRRLS